MTAMVVPRAGAFALFAWVLWSAPVSAQSQSMAYYAPMRAAASDAEEAAADVPAHLRRQTVSYATSEAPGTIIIDTPNTYLYYVLGGGKAIRYGIGVGREGFTWSGVKSVERKSDRIGSRPPRCSSVSPTCRASRPAAPPIRSAPVPSISAALCTASTAPTSRPA
jgi:hypothetical protein